MRTEMTVSVRDIEQLRMFAPTARNKTLRTVNPRIPIAGYRRTELQHLFDSWLSSTPANMPAHHRLLFGLILGMAATDTRLDEFDIPLTDANVWQFFFAKRDMLYRLRGGMIDNCADSTFAELVGSCTSARLSVPGDLTRVSIFDGGVPSIRECYLSLRPVGIPRLDQADGSGSIVELKSRIDDIGHALRSAGDQYEVVVITYPVRMVGATPQEFACSVITDPGIPWTPQKTRAITSRMLLHKRKERSEIAAKGYVKLYVNTSLYRNAQRGPRGHRFVGFNSAMRQVIDLDLNDGTLWGMADVRVARVTTEELFAERDLEELIGASEQLKAHIGAYLPAVAAQEPTVTHVPEESIYLVAVVFDFTEMSPALHEEFEAVVREAEQQQGFLGYRWTYDAKQAILLSFWRSMDDIDEWQANTRHVRSKRLSHLQGLAARTYIAPVYATY
jgi:heme-degrading monooxygenase HmoA